MSNIPGGRAANRIAIAALQDLAAWVERCNHVHTPADLALLEAADAALLRLAEAQDQLEEATMLIFAHGDWDEGGGSISHKHFEDLRKASGLSQEALLFLLRMESEPCKDPKES
jgi:hypothetical protein